MTKSERRKLRKEALRAFKEEGQETAYKARWIRRAETSGVRKARKPSDIFLHGYSPDVGPATSSFVLSEIERAASEDLG